MAKTFSLSGTKKQKKIEKVDVDFAEAEARALAHPNGRVWYPEQQAIFDWCKQGEGHLTVEALAGTGKTTTIVEALRYLPSSRVLVCAFNKRIADELKTRCADRAHVYTLHALGLRLWKRQNPNVTIDNLRGWKLADAGLKSVGMPTAREYRRAVQGLAGQAKGMAPYADKPADLDSIGWNFGHFDGLSPKEIDGVRIAAFKAMQLAFETNDGTMDFDDMLYLPLKRKLTRGEYDYVVVDEAQDMNFSQLELAMQIMNERGSLIVVGDSNQAIYGFRGADSSSLQRITKRMNSKVLTLTTTYRCPKKVVKFANFWVKGLKAADSAPEGVVRAGSVTEAQPGDFIISRLNAPLLSMCLELVTAGKRAKVEGRDVGKMLTGIIDKLKPADTEDLIHKMATWEANQVRHAGDDETLVQAAIDTSQSISYLARETGDIAKLKSLIDSMFEDSQPGVAYPRITLMTGHKAKGLEADRVFVLCDTFRGGFRIGSGGEEANLRYVTATRAKKELVMINPEWDVKDDDAKGDVQ